MSAAPGPRGAGHFSSVGPLVPLHRSGFASEGVDRSIRANTRTSLARTAPRDEVIEKFRQHLMDSTELLAIIPNLEGRKIMCHCELDQRYHGDVLIEAFSHYAQMVLDAVPRDPPADDIIVREAAARRTGVAGSLRADFVARAVPTKVAGEGAPL